ncbi:unnamed protein product [Trifolium pratense]|uniref:Uncharacterized protein n=1 Tax=Trifolium pratense TaxID=57577 RepID=A0ACB0M783_TRIPR|nr:unnamed protein product [Trifolium pratense]
MPGATWTYLLKLELGEYQKTLKIILERDPTHIYGFYDVVKYNIERLEGTIEWASQTQTYDEDDVRSFQKCLQRDLNLSRIQKTLERLPSANAATSAENSGIRA